MSPKLQTSLLRVLQERNFQRLGGTTLRGSDFRLICPCNLDIHMPKHTPAIRPRLLDWPCMSGRGDDAHPGNARARG